MRLVEDSAAILTNPVVGDILTKEGGNHKVIDVTDQDVATQEGWPVAFGEAVLVTRGEFMTLFGGADVAGWR
jgi:hypothetical protein